MLLLSYNYIITLRIQLTTENIIANVCIPVSVFQLPEL